MRYLIYSFEHKGYWKADEQGYTKNKKEAGEYTFFKAKEICLKANQFQGEDEIPNEMMIPIN